MGVIIKHDISWELFMGQPYQGENVDRMNLNKKEKMTRVEDGWVREETNIVEIGTVTMSSTAKMTLDDLNNVWYKSDIEKVLGKIVASGRFIPTPNQDFTSEMLSAISVLIIDFEKPRK